MAHIGLIAFWFTPAFWYAPKQLPILNGYRCSSHGVGVRLCRAQKPQRHDRGDVRDHAFESWRAINDRWETERSTETA